ncbi:Rap1a/Tai family immunity protein [Ralstonia pseudosolanacearum]|uniref:Rap1a/Tai family immunity protein n=1 Tax=Ralstonia pseudosolanacearum TaxID=1310165 RepID=UPI003CF8C282
MSSALALLRKRGLAQLLIGLGLALSSISSTATYLEGGYVTGNQFRTRAKFERMNYVAGVVDGVLSSPQFGASEQTMHTLKVCIQTMTAGQLLAIVDQYMAANPSQWDWQMNFLTIRALALACVERGTPIRVDQPLTR